MFQIMVADFEFFDGVEGAATPSLFQILAGLKSMDCFKGKFTGKTPYFIGKLMVSG